MASDSSGPLLYNANDSENATHDEIWDDTLLIQQYDQAMAQVRQKLHRRLSGTNTTESEQSTELLQKTVEHLSENKSQGANVAKKKKKKRNKKKTDWNVGDACRCQYSGDGIWYEGTVIAVNSEGGSCTVRYVGYNNEEEVPLHTLAKSKGEAARHRQRDIADDGQSEQSDLGSSVIESDMQSDTDVERTHKRHRAPHTHRSQSGSMPPPNFPTGGSQFAPPPHLPHLPPPPALTMDLTSDPQTSEALHTMLMSWYMTGYHTGYYQGLRQAQTRKLRK
nr:survival motor neuron protein-like [Procambarus clarkii]